MKINHLPLILLLFLVFLSGCTKNNYVFTKEPVTYNIVVPPGSNALRDVTLVTKGNDISFVRNNKEIAAIRIGPVPPPPCKCHPGSFRFILLDESRGVIYDRQNKLIIPVNVENLPTDLMREINSLPNQSFTGQR